MKEAPSNNESKWMHPAIKYSKQQSHDEPAQPPPAMKASGCTNHFQNIHKLSTLLPKEEWLFELPPAPHNAWGKAITSV
jgi:hypothetical protein